MKSFLTELTLGNNHNVNSTLSDHSPPNIHRDISYERYQDEK